MENAIFALVGTLLGGLLSYFLQRQRFAQEIALKREEFKTEYMAESTAKHFLSHKSHIDRSFETLRNHLGGFTDDELRKILVRAGAVRVVRKDDSEWWRLLSRWDEYVVKKRIKN